MSDIIYTDMITLDELCEILLIGKNTAYKRKW